MKAKQVVKIVLFVALQVVLLYVCSLISFRNLRGFNDHSAFYECEENSIDVIFTGGSVAFCGFSPMELYENYGISSYNFGTTNQYMISGYLWAKEAYKTQDYKVIIVEAQQVAMSHGDLGTDIRSLFSMGINENFLELATTYKRNFYKVLFPVMVLHDEWTIDSDTFKPVINENASYLRGYVPINSLPEGGMTEPLVKGDKTAMDYLKYPYVDKLRVFCEENGIQLIFVKTLIATDKEKDWADGRHNNLAAYAAQYDIPFIDFNTKEYMEAAGLDMTTDVTADLRHVNVNGAKKITNFLGEYLINMEGLELDLYQDKQINEDVLERYHEIVAEN